MVMIDKAFNKIKPITLGAAALIAASALSAPAFAQDTCETLGTTIVYRVYHRASGCTSCILTMHNLPIPA